MSRRLWLGFISTLCVVSLTACGPQSKPEEECNFVQNSQLQRVSWQRHLPVQIFFDTSVPQEFMPAITRSMKVWNDSLGSRAIFEFAGVIEQGQQPVQDQVSVIYWRKDWDEGRENEQARTTIFWKGDKIQEADIQVNARDFKFSVSDETVSGAIDVESLLIHELGHALGLAHNESSGSVMASRLGSSVLRREISKADLDSIRCEY